QLDLDPRPQELVRFLEPHTAAGAAPVTAARRAAAHASASSGNLTSVVAIGAAKKSGLSPASAAVAAGGGGQGTGVGNGGGGSWRGSPGGGGVGVKGSGMARRGRRRRWGWGLGWGWGAGGGWDRGDVFFYCEEAIPLPSTPTLKLFVVAVALVQMVAAVHASGVFQALAEVTALAWMIVAV
ncbi:unnamed protein product, partial [Laminaria digitata]